MRNLSIKQHSKKKEAKGETMKREERRRRRVGRRK